MTYNQVM